MSDGRASERLGMAPSGRLILVRHGESEGNQLRRFSLTPEIGLTECGVGQARAVGRRIHELFRPTAVIASSFRRARRTAEIIAIEIGLARPVAIEPDLRERSIGELAGQPYESMHEHPTFDGTRFWEWRPPDGESLVDVAQRAAPVLDRLARTHPAQDVVVVSHGGVMLALCAHIEGGWQRPRVARNCEPLIVTHAPGEAMRLFSLEEHLAAQAKGSGSCVRPYEPSPGVSPRDDGQVDETG